MTRTEMVDLLKLFLNVNNSQLDDSISETQWAAFIQRAYSTVWQRIRGQVSRATLLVSQDIQWPAGQPTFTLPVNLQNAVIYDIWTLDGSGNPLCQFNGFFETRNVLRVGSVSWALSGYNLRYYYIPEAETLGANDVPALIPPQYHETIVWEALRVVKMLFDKEIPGNWQEKQEEIEFTLVKEQSTRPVNQRANIMAMGSPMVRPLSSYTY